MFAATLLIALAAGPDRSAAGPHAVEAHTFEWADPKRDRTVPVKLYLPKADGPAPVVVFSHGLGGSRDGYEYLGRHWASHGYAVVHLQHAGSDAAVWRGAKQPMEAMRKAAADPRNAVERARDVSFVLDELARRTADGPLKGRFDLSKVGVGGHSFGANTTLLVVGQSPPGRESPFLDGRVKAAVPMSAPVPARGENREKAFAAVAVPCLHMTGTLDDSPVGDTKPADRRVPFDGITRADQYLVTFEGGDHMVFSGRGRTGMAAGKGKPEKDARFQALTREATLAFWDAYLRGDGSAKEFLAGGGFKSSLAADGVWEAKPGR